MNRLADVLVSGTALALSSPVVALAALAVKLEDGGPVLYRQTRVGKDGVDFELLKLRTMVVGAERQGAGWAVNAGDSKSGPGSRGGRRSTAGRSCPGTSESSSTSGTSSTARPGST